MRRVPRAGLAALLAVAAACGDAPAPRAHRYFVPAVVRPQGGGRIPWQTRVVVSNDAAREATLRIGRWPPASRDFETEVVRVGAGASRAIPTLVPPLPTVSSLYLESDVPLRVSAELSTRGRAEPLPLALPVLDAEALARAGDTLVVGPFVSDAERRSFLTFSMPWTERDSVPFRVALLFEGLDGRALGRATLAIPGVPWVVADPWERFRLPAGVPFTLRATLLGATVRRPPRFGLWAYGIEQSRATFASRLVSTRVERAPKPS